MHRHHKKHSPRSESAAGDVLSRAGLEGLLAGIPTAVMFTVREAVATNLRGAVSSVMDKSEKAANEAVNRSIGKVGISAPMVVAALIVGGAVMHGAWVGKRKHEARSFAESEQARRAAHDTAARGQAGA